jgi:lysophospholipase L1-like esterase
MSSSSTEDVMQRLIVSLIVLFSGPALFIDSPARAGAPPASEGGVAVATRPAASTKHNFAKWEKAISDYEQADREHPPEKGGVLFIGSSTILRWTTLAKDFPDHHVINRAFGGSEIEDATHFADRIVFPYEPRAIFLRAGGNDIDAGKSAERVFADYKAFVKKVHAKLPNTRIEFISLSPAPKRWKDRDANKALNQLVKTFASGKPYLGYVETYDMTLKPDGQARDELFVADRLHFNAEGYKLLAERIRPALKSADR